MATKKQTTEKATSTKAKTTTAKKNSNSTVDKANRVKATQKVLISRDVKYKYPKDVTDPLARKKWRQKVRNNIRKLEAEISKLRGADRTAKKTELTTYQNKVMA